MDVITELPVDTSVFSLSTASQTSLRFNGKPTSRDPWLFNSPFEYKIKVSLGMNYFTEFSEPFEVIVEDPCFASSLDSVNLGPYVTEVGAGPLFVTIDQIKDSVS